MTHFSKKLISWYIDNQRELPWRLTNDPYRIWLSEIILQQTRVDQGMPYYFAFINAFPDVFSLASADEDEVLKLWQGLGYYSRARNLHTTAKMVAFDLQGIFPNNYKDLLKLKGVGDYTASAIASICFNEPAAVVDGNVYRVLSRVFGIKTPIDTTIGKREFKELAQHLIDQDDPATFNQAIMEFGAIQCKPKNPYCLHCPFNDSCVALRENKIDRLPVKQGKIKVRDRHFNYLVYITDDGKTILNQRDAKGIWGGLYEFPLIETEKNYEPDDFLKFLEDDSMVQEPRSMYAKLPQLGSADVRLYNDKAILHKLSHQNLYVKFWIASVSDIKSKNAVPIANVIDFAVPRVIDRFLETFDFSN
ncbi:A/G-specific adenine glycosylase [Leeuwenhoekiella sp. A16]|uniref:A/G-specific adenine glycosylase n=1 Tax=unclassified Leeuwenhoekiella TaxID=2615029 RepID=UPI003A7FB611